MIFITGGIFIGLFIASLGLILKKKGKKKIIHEEKREKIITNPNYDRIIIETPLGPDVDNNMNLGQYYEEPQITYDFASGDIDNYYDNL